MFCRLPLLIFILFGMSSFAATTFAVASPERTIIISDIDDTIRQSNIVSKRRSFGNLLIGMRSFDRMREIFSEMKSAHPETDIFYVSGGPQILNPEAWLSDHHFPKGTVYAKNFAEMFRLSTVQHKLRSIDKIFAKYDLKNLTVYAFGDNGEHDPEIYKLARESYPQVNFKVFIRDIKAEATDFGSLLPAPIRVAGHHYYLTEIDLLKTRGFEGWLTQSFVVRLCRDFQAEAGYRDGYESNQQRPDFLIPEFVRWEIRSKVLKACTSNAAACQDEPTAEKKYRALLRAYVKETLKGFDHYLGNYRILSWFMHPIFD